MKIIRTSVNRKSTLRTLNLLYYVNFIFIFFREIYVFWWTYICFRSSYSAHDFEAGPLAVGDRVIIKEKYIGKCNIIYLSHHFDHIHIFTRIRRHGALVFHLYIGMFLQIFFKCVILIIRNAIVFDKSKISIVNFVIPFTRKCNTFQSKYV